MSSIFLALSPFFPVVQIRLRLVIVFLPVIYYFLFFLYYLHCFVQCVFIHLWMCNFCFGNWWFCLFGGECFCTSDLFLSFICGFRFVYNVAIIICYYYCVTLWLFFKFLEPHGPPSILGFEHYFLPAVAFFFFFFSLSSFFVFSFFLFLFPFSFPFFSLLLFPF